MSAEAQRRLEKALYEARLNGEIQEAEERGWKNCAEFFAKLAKEFAQGVRS